MSVGIVKKMPRKEIDKVLDILLNMRERIIAQLNLAPEIMKQFCTDIKEGVVDELPDTVKKPHITATAQWLRAVFEGSSLSEIRKTLQRDDIWRFFELNKWSSAGIVEHNMYVAPQVLVISSKIGKNRKGSAKVDKAIKCLISGLKTLLLLQRQKIIFIKISNGFILYWTIRALKEYWHELTEEERKIVNSGLNYLENLFYRELALYSLKETAFDPIQLSYYLLALIQYTGFRDHKATREAIRIIFSEQKDGIWESSSFLHAPHGPVMYCMSIEAVTAIARMIVFREDLLDMLEEFAQNIQRVMEWVEFNQREVNGYSGWRSERHPAGGPESWASALVLEFLESSKVVLEKCIRQRVIKEFGGMRIPPKVHWSEILDYRGFKHSIEDSVIDPIKKKGMPNKGYGILLYGLPACGKDSIVFALAEELGDWEIIVLTPENFLTSENVILNARMIFRKLALLERAVVFFNEIDQIIAPRGIPQEFATPAALTACMLNWLPQLKESKVVFVVATNYIENFEEALRRHGRFDLVLPIGSPEEEERLRLVKHQLRELIEKKLVNESDVEIAVKMMDRKLVVGDIVRFCSRVKDIAAEGKELTQKTIVSIVEQLNKYPSVDQELLDKFEGNVKKYERLG